LVVADRCTAEHFIPLDATRSLALHT